MNEKLKYTGRVESGKIMLPGAKMRAEVSRIFEGKEIECTIQRKVKHRTNLQNRFYWGVVVPMVRAGIKDLGDIVSESQAHDTLKMRFLKEQRIDDTTGEVLFEYTKSTADLTTVQFIEYIEQCAQFAAEYLGVTIPEPA